MRTDELRGHRLIPSDDVLRDWPNLYATENLPMADKLIHAHFFVGACDWWLAEIDHSDLRLSFGFVSLGDPQLAEWGYFDLDELADTAVRHPAGFWLVVERDLHWTSKPFREIKEARS